MLMTQEFDSPSREQFFKDLQGKYANVVAIYRHNDSASSIGVFDKELIEALPKSVKYICHNGAGYDQSELGFAQDANRIWWMVTLSLIFTYLYLIRTLHQICNRSPSIHLSYNPT
jgi:lactate dehydrogenase-like 2-hydroxyacid dehydrogenase